MTADAERLMQSVLALPEDERTQFVEALIAECDRSLRRPFDDAWMPEIERRSREIDAGTAQLSPWDEAKRRGRARVEGQSDG
ncbi:MAG: addiction module protein [Pirellulales bacterium]